MFRASIMSWEPASNPFFLNLMTLQHSCIIIWNVVQITWILDCTDFQLAFFKCEQTLMLGHRLGLGVEALHSQDTAWTRQSDPSTTEKLIWTPHCIVVTEHFAWRINIVNLGSVRAQNLFQWHATPDPHAISSTTAVSLLHGTSPIHLLQIKQLNLTCNRTEHPVEGSSMMEER